MKALLNMNALNPALTDGSFCPHFMEEEPRVQRRHNCLLTATQ